MDKAKHIWMDDKTCYYYYTNKFFITLHKVSIMNNITGKRTDPDTWYFTISYPDTEDRAKDTGEWDIGQAKRKVLILMALFKIDCIYESYERITYNDIKSGDKVLQNTDIEYDAPDRNGEPLTDNVDIIPTNVYGKDRYDTLRDYHLAFIRTIHSNGMQILRPKDL